MSNSLKNEIEEFAEEYLNRYPTPKVKREKVIHDTLWGTILFNDYEVDLIDTPLIQRLRQIRQTAFTYLTYPSSTHSRFEHTLGVVHQCTRLASVLKEKYPKKSLITDDTIVHIRLAALLHDCGHGPFSHTSEEIYRLFPEMQKLIGANCKFEKKNPHEVIAHLVINSEPFKKYFEGLQSRYKNFRADKTVIANTIIKESDKLQRYKVEILNGPFDADKLDYIFRDSHFSGLKLSVDLDRLWYTAGIGDIKYKDKKKSLTADWTGLFVEYNGIISLEQILFCKMILFSTIYHHPKVRACDCMLKGIIEYCQHNGTKIGGRSLKKIVDFLYLTDYKILHEADKTKDKNLHKLIHNLLYRRLLKRAIVISMKTVSDDSKNDLLKLINKNHFTPENYKNLREDAYSIWKKAGKPCLKEEVWIDLPTLPHNKEVNHTYIKQANNTFEPLNESFPIEDWVKQYGLNKWRGHVFCPPDDNIRQKIFKAAQELFEEKYGLKFNEYAKLLCRVPHSIDIDS